MRKEDATPSWSGYIFQGEVALCMALEKIISLGNNIPNDDYCLQLEENEDFSLTTDHLEVFQVKAYLSNDSNKFSKYKDVIEELISKYYYSVTISADPEDGRKTIKAYSPVPRDNPIKSTLITALVIDDVDESLSTFDEKYRTINFDYFKIIHGHYKLDNIIYKIDDAIKILYPDLQESDIEIKRCYCCSEISKRVYDRHRTKQVESIPFNTIKNWLENSPSAFTEEICWYEITKIFFDNLRIGIEHYDINIPEQKSVVDKLNNVIFIIENLSINEIRKLLSEHLTPHKKINQNTLRKESMDFINGATVKNVIQKALKMIEDAPIYKTLQYNKGKTTYQLTVHNEDFDMNDPSEKILFQKHCEKIYNQPLTKEIDYFVTSNLEREKEEVKDRLYEILETDAEFNKHEKLDHNEETENKFFGFRKIDKAILEINDNDEKTNQ